MLKNNKLFIFHMNTRNVRQSIKEMWRVYIFIGIYEFYSTFYKWCLSLCV